MDGRLDGLMLMTMVVIIVVVVAVDMMCEVVVTNGGDRYMKMFCFVFEILLHLNPAQASQSPESFPLVNPSTMRK
jgi:hypothetical protein